MRRRLTSKNHLTSDGEKDNSRMFKSEKKNHTFEKSQSSELSFIRPTQKNNNSESASFTGLLKSLLALWVLKETRQNLAYVFELKAFN